MFYEFSLYTSSLFKNNFSYIIVISNFISFKKRTNFTHDLIINMFMILGKTGYKSILTSEQTLDWGVGIEKIIRTNVTPLQYKKVFI